MAEQADLLRMSLMREAGQVAGEVRITALGTLIEGLLMPHMPRLRAQHPDLRLEFIASMHNLSLSRREADIALRLARPQTLRKAAASGEDTLTRKAADLGFAVYAAGSAGLPEDPDAAWVGYDESLAHLPESLWLARNAPGDRVVLRCNSLTALTEAVALGIGHGLLPCYRADTDRRLVRVSGPKPVVRRELWLLVHPDVRQTARVRAVIDWLDTLWREYAEVLSGQ